MKIDRTKNSICNCYDYCLIDGNKEIYIFFAGTLDLYMLACIDKLLPPNENITIDFDITKENYDLYLAFDKLYNRIVNSQAYSNPEIYLVGKNEYDRLVDENKNIVWISDNGPADIEDRLVISQEEDSYKLSFIRNDKPMDFGFKSNSGIGIRFRNDGSRYNPFNCMFLELYENLQKINPEYHQISFEELEYKDKVKKLVK